MEDENPNKAKSAEARHAAKALLKTAGVKKAPVMINQLLPFIPHSFNLVIKGTREHIPKGVDAFTHKDTDLTIIGFNQNVSPTRQKFSVAHELGHLYMGHLHSRSSLDINSLDFDEIEANQFAAHLLMPTTILRKDIKKGIREVDSLARLYGVSEEAMWWQLSKNGLLNLL